MLPQQVISSRPVPSKMPRPWASQPGERSDGHSSLALRRAIAWLPDHASKSDRAGGAWHPSPGAIYPTIAQLEDEGLLTTREEGGSRLVTITIQGACTTGGAQRPTQATRSRTSPMRQFS